MITPHISKTNAVGLAEAVVLVREELRERMLLDSSSERIFRIAVPILPLDLFAWLSQQKMFPRVFWSASDQVFRSVGIGKAWEFQAGSRDERQDWQMAESLIAQEPQCRVYMGSSFYPKESQAEWQGFGQRRMLVPRFEVIESKGEFFFVCTLVALADGGLPWEIALKDLDRIMPQRDIPLGSLSVMQREDLPHFEDWEKIVNKVLALIDHGTLQKAVLARRTSLSFSNGIDPVVLLKKLSISGVWGYGFLFQISSDKAFLSWTPEILFRKNGEHLQADAIAGTRARHADHIIDNELQEELSSSEKDSREHGMVVAQIKEVFVKLCCEMSEAASPRILKLKHQQHRCQEIRGVLNPGVTLGDIYKELHPTPAVGGVPSDEALKVINELEPFERGWFAGAIGMLTKDGAELAVAIRSALVSGGKLHLYAGAGTVAGSSSRTEWEEIEAKIRNYLDVIHA